MLGMDPHEAKNLREQRLGGARSRELNTLGPEQAEGECPSGAVHGCSCVLHCPFAIALPSGQPVEHAPWKGSAGSVRAHTQ